MGGNWKKIGLLREIGIFAGEIKENLDFEEKIGGIWDFREEMWEKIDFCGENEGKKIWIIVGNKRNFGGINNFEKKKTFWGLKMGF